MSRTTLQVRFVLLMALLVALAMFIGTEPWGPV